MQNSVINLVGLASQDGDNLPTVINVSNTDFSFEVEQEMDNQDPPQPMPGNFFFVKRGFFKKGKCALIFQQSENNQSKPADIIVDHNYAEPDKIKITTLSGTTGQAQNGILNLTPFQLTVNMGCND